jgi:DNA-binding SARP family transcriptional activator
MEFCVLGPLEARRDGRPVALGGAKQRALLAVLLLHAGEVVSTDRLIDELWGDDPPATAAHTVQVFVSRLRKALGDGGAALVTAAPGYAVRLEPGALDLERFEQLVSEGRSALEEGDADAASARLRDALALWRGPALADFSYEAFAQPAIARLEELRLSALADRIEADLALGRHGELIGELESLVAEHPLRERFRGQLMLALYRSGRQADALDAYQEARRVLVEELGIEPGPPLQRLERAILVQDAALELPERPRARRSAPVSEDEDAVPVRTILTVSFAHEGPRSLIALAEALAGSGSPHDLLVCRLVHPAEAEALGAVTAALEDTRAGLAERGIAVRVAAFTSPRPAGDAVRLAADEKVDLLLLDCPVDALTGAAFGPELTAILAEAPCDVGLVVPRGSAALGEGGRPVLVPFGGGEHDWGALELGAWTARAHGLPLRLLGTAGDSGAGRDASRLLAVASLAVQRLVGVGAESRLAAAGSQAILEQAGEVGLVVLGLPERWRQEGLGEVRSAVAARAGVPVLLVRRGVRPSGLAPPESLTRFTWSLAGGGS